ncbi:MAG: hypothetical protein Q8J68_05590 [Methanolobus sp.]|uniref:hypothetical protein n=1 Tax=Methanolobus sp. TaxID=1874737 RepID=UPI00272F3C0A|nr:hypothetical protein [Methanolobus sp.]MDP2216743.1 hypothetical protein [Methanolobus sp.]
MAEIDIDTYDKIIETRNDVKHIRASIDKVYSRLDDHDRRLAELGKCPVDDHEKRIRALEVQQNKWLGKNAAIGFGILVALQLLGFMVSLSGR